MKIVFVPDGGAAAGLGHLSRCVAVSQAFEILYGVQSKFLVSDLKSKSWLSDRGIESIDEPQGNWDIMVFDTYLRSPAVVSDLSSQAKVVVAFDDNFNPPSGARWIINTSLRVKAASYIRSRPENLLLGPTYHPLQSEYWSSRPNRCAASSVRDVLITLGGGIHEATLFEIVEELGPILVSGRFHILVGPHADPGISALNGEHVFVHRSPANVRDMLASADLAISGGGQTLFELAYLGVPTIAIQVARNQQENILGFSDEGAVVPAGDISQPGWKRLLRKAFRRVIEEQGKRVAMAEAGRKLIDGKGAIRLAKVLAT